MTTDAAELDRANRETWARAAAGWEKWQAELREATAPVAQWLVEALDPAPGQRILELAAGPGETGFRAAQRLGPTGKLISSDQSQEMVAVARRRATELGLDNVEFAVLDGQSIELPSGSVDGVLCRFGYMLMTDPDAALRDSRRVIRDGGRLALATWSTPDKNLWMATPAIALVARGALPPPDPTATGPFAMANPEQLEQRITAAGFSDAKAQALEFVQVYPSFDQYWGVTLDLAAPITEALGKLDAAARDEVRDGVREALGRFTLQDDRIEVPATAVLAVATA
jgi:SAM-dependent methyltransferase